MVYYRRCPGKPSTAEFSKRDLAARAVGRPLFGTSVRSSYWDQVTQQRRNEGAARGAHVFILQVLSRRWSPGGAPLDMISVWFSEITT